jgi:urease accessory protein UreH
MITRLQRAQGQLRVGFRCGRDGGTSLTDLFQEGCLKARLPRPQSAGEADGLNEPGSFAK